MPTASTSSPGGRRPRKRAKLARGSDADAARPATVADAVAAYERDLVARGGSIANAGRIRKHLTPTLAAKPVGLLSARELAAWRDGLLAAGMKPATAVRLAKASKAASPSPPSATTASSIAQPGATACPASPRASPPATCSVSMMTRSARLSPRPTRSIVRSGFTPKPLALTGARNSQVARLTVADLQADNGTPRLMMPYLA